MSLSKPSSPFRAQFALSLPPSSLLPPFLILPLHREADTDGTAVLRKPLTAFKPCCLKIIAVTALGLGSGSVGKALART